jgi:hypothetical protein
VGPLAVPAAAAGPDLLERHRPLLRYDREERHFATSVSSLTEASRLEREQGSAVDAPEPSFLGARYGDGRRARESDRLRQVRPTPRGTPLVYGRTARDGEGRIWLQYWLFFADNTQDRGAFRTGRHTGDWELVQVRVGAGRRPVEVTLAQHTWAEGCRWSQMERAGRAPVVYVANGSHALLSRPGTSDRPFPDPNDEADGRGRRVRPVLQRVRAGTPPWMGWPGRWGASQAGIVPGEQPSPRGPAFQPDRWKDPGAFHATEAVACGSGPPGRPWQTALTVGAALLIAGGLLAALRSYNR